MYLLGKRADQLIAEDIVRLVNNQIQETKALDYKKELKLSQDKDKKEFLFDITSMYNTDGGCLIYGIEERKDDKGQNTGIPNTITGIVIENLDKLSQQIEDVVKANSEPSISNIIINHLTVSGKDILVIGIAKGLGLPTMVTFNETNKFYRRRNSGKYPVDVYELNQMFMQNKILKESAEKFRQDRISRVLSLKAFPILETSSSCFIQIIPFTFQDEQLLDLSNANKMELSAIMRPMYCSGWDLMFNIDGIATFGTDRAERQKIISYDQLFRNGIYEAYTGSLIENYTTNNNQTIKQISGAYFVKGVVDKLTESFNVLKMFKVEAPYIISISLFETRGAVIYDGNNRSKQIMANEISLPALFLLNTQVDLYKVLKSNLDILWQASGYPQSPAYSAPR